MTLVQPKTREELIDIIAMEMAENGVHCDLNHVDVSLITNMTSVFAKSSKGSPNGFFNGDISKWDTSNVTNMNAMFEFSAFNGNISNWDVSNVEDMTRMFYVSGFDGDLSNWDVSNTRTMKEMFYASKFNGDISNWNVFRVKDMEKMFATSNFLISEGYPSRFNGDVSKWNLRKLKHSASMFEFSQFTGDLRPWFENSPKVKKQYDTMFGDSKEQYEAVRRTIEEKELLINTFNANSKVASKSKAL